MIILTDEQAAKVREIVKYINDPAKHEALAILDQAQRVEVVGNASTIGAITETMFTKKFSEKWQPLYAVKETK